MIKYVDLNGHPSNHTARHEARLRLQQKLAFLHRRAWRSSHDYTWLLWLLDNEWRYS